MTSIVIPIYQNSDILLQLYQKIRIELEGLKEKFEVRFVQGDILRLGLNISFIPYKRAKREIGKSQWSFFMRYKYFWDALVISTFLPIKLIILIGVFFSFYGFLYVLVVTYVRFINATPFKGYAPIVILILLIGGIIMLMLGVIGEYVWRIYDETKKRPNYLIKKIHTKRDI